MSTERGKWDLWARKRSEMLTRNGWQRGVPFSPAREEESSLGVADGSGDLRPRASLGLGGFEARGVACHRTDMSPATARLQ